MKSYYLIPRGYTTTDAWYWSSYKPKDCTVLLKTFSLWVSKNGTLLGTLRKSGAHWDNADLSTHTLLIEAKVRHEPFFKPSKKELEKLIAQASKHCKDWAYIQKTDGGTFVVCDLEFFTEATEAYFND